MRQPRTAIATGIMAKMRRILWRRVGVSIETNSLTTSLTTVGLLPASDFPSEPYERVHAAVKSQNRKIAWKEYAGGWNAVAYRFMACSECDDDFTASVQDSGVAPKPEQRFVQEKSLFCFFVTALSTIECFFFAAYAVGAMVNPVEFNLSNPKKIKPAMVTERFQKCFPSENLTAALNTVIADLAYKEIAGIRHVLAHRTSPGRVFFAGGEKDGTARWLDDIEIRTGRGHEP